MGDRAPGSDRWGRAPDELPPLGGDVHVWAVSLDQDPAVVGRIEPTLSDDERRRARRFRFLKDAEAFVVSHGATRAILARYLGIRPEAVTFETGEHGKPRLSPPDPGIRFNLSHSGGLALLAVADGAEVGVDVERVVGFPDLLAVARASFSDAEVAALLKLPGRDRTDAFYRCWTRKEAVVKALGTGLSAPLRAFTVSLEAGDARVLRAPPGGEVGGWRLEALQAGPDHAAALAVRRAGGGVALWRWDPA